MGIVGLFGKWLSRANYIGVLTKRRPEKVSSLSIDMNAFFHGLTRDKDMTNIESYMNDITNLLMVYIKTVRPQDLVILAVDGVAPNAKVEQQRMRRYRSAMDREEGVWDSNRITPGTDFMFQLDTHIKNWLKVNRAHIGVKIIYSNHMVRGEGEHKIVKLLGEQGFGRDTTHVIGGLDSDLILLGLNLKLKTYLVRERIDRTSDGVPQIQLDEWVNLDALGSYLTKDMHAGDRQQAIYDFTIIICLIGNDFLPRVTSLQTLTTSIPYMIDTYRRNGLALTSLVDGRPSINWANMARFLHRLSTKELASLKELHRGEFTKYSVIESLYDDAGDRWDMDMYSERYIAYISRQGFDISSIFPNLDITIEPEPTLASDLAQSYLAGIGWVFNYYTRGVANPDYIYPSRYAPTLHMLAESDPPQLDTYMPSKDKPFIYLNPLHVMLGVLPPRSKTIMPPFLHSVMKDPRYVNMFPTKVSLDFEGTFPNATFAAKIHVPPVDISQIIEALTDIKLNVKDLKRYQTDVNVVYNLSDEEKKVREERARVELVLKEDAQPSNYVQPKDAWKNPRFLKI